MQCPECNTVLSVKDINNKTCPTCSYGIKISEDKKIPDDFDFNSIKVTTAPTLENYKIIDTIDIVTSETVFGMNIFRDFFAGITDFFGGRSEASQKILRDARKLCILELKKEAYRAGGNAVIGVDLDYSEISGKGKGMLFLVASGTAVKVEKMD